MLSKLAFNNVKKSMKDFTIYFLTLSFGVCLFYVFNSIDSQQAMLTLNKDQRETIKLLTETISIISIFISVILGFLIVYANNFLIKRRKKELGIYLTLGMERISVSWILIKETFLIGIVALVAGLLCGIFLSQGLAVLTAKMFKVTMKEFTFIFSKSAFLKSILYFGVIFAIVMIFNTITVSRVKLIDLIYANKKNEKLRVKNIWISVILFIVSIICLGFAYHLIIENGMFVLDNTFYGSIVFGTIGTFLFFLSLSGFLLKVVQGNKSIYFRGLNMFVLRQINSKITTTFVSMSLICIMLLMAIGVLSTGAGVARTMSNVLESNTPVDVTLMEYHMEDSKDSDGKSINPDKDYIIKKMKKDNVKLDDILNNYTTLNICTLNNKLEPILKYIKPSRMFPKETLEIYKNTKIEYASLSDYNNILKSCNKKPISLKENEFAISSNYNEILPEYKKFIENSGVLKINNKEYKSIDNLVYGSVCNSPVSNLALIIVPDSALKDSKPIRQIINIDLKGDNKNSSELFESRIDKIYKEKDNKKPFVLSLTKEKICEESAGLSTVVSYIAVYVGVVFLITCSAIIALQQLSESSDNIERYKLLRKIGVEESDINKSLFIQILITFMMPLSLALVHSFVGVRVANDVVKYLGQFDAMNGIIASAFAILIIYGGYMISTYFGSKSIIKDNN
ncbi:FtsX-like permease family protein [Terrisporobacter petrolearius]|uniref:FtsX-like permease family protein n=1 Tax=Terrisporobacter petrolearius TaxID=1460447 RepID=UPI003AFFA797